MISLSCDMHMIRIHLYKARARVGDRFHKQRQWFVKLDFTSYFKHQPWNVTLQYDIKTTVES